MTRSKSNGYVKPEHSSMEFDPDCRQHVEIRRDSRGRVVSLCFAEYNDQGDLMEVIRLCPVGTGRLLRLLRDEVEYSVL